jgi:penicillin-insensitive murein endopeptidase
MLGCASLGAVDDGTSVSYGPSNAGILLNPAQLPVRGDGYLIPERWAKRGLRYGTDEAVALIVHAAREVDAGKPGGTLGVGDLSPRRGGPSAWHRSHQTGRDIDLIYFAVDDRGRPVEPEYMHRFGRDGVVVRNSENGEAPVLRFDVERNWLLVKALIDNPVADVQWIFVADWLKQLMLDHAKERGEPTHVVLAASYLLAQPGDSLPHDDHMHLRVYCAPTDRIIGCSDRGSFRWHKRDRKYVVRYSAVPYVEPLLRLLAKQRITALALSALPFPGLVAR